MSLAGVTDFFSDAYNYLQDQFMELRHSLRGRGQVLENDEIVLIPPRPSRQQVSQPSHQPEEDSSVDSDDLVDGMAKLSLRVPCIESIESYDNAIFLFADMESYSLRTKRISSKELTHLLNAIYSEFMNIVKIHGRSYGIEVVKLTGDCIMLSGRNGQADLSMANQAKAMVNVGWELLSYLRQFNKNREDDPVNFRFGISVGPAERVKITLTDNEDLSKVTYDWIGEGVNFAARMESSSLPNQIQLSEEMYRLVADKFTCSPCEHEVKSYGTPKTFFIVHPKKWKPSKEALAGEERASSGPLLRKFSKEDGVSSAPTLRKSSERQDEEIQKVFCVLHPLKRRESKESKEAMRLPEGSSSAPTLRRASSSDMNY